MAHLKGQCILIILEICFLAQYYSIKKYSLGNILEQKELSHFFTDGEVKKTKAYDNFLQLYPQNYPECKDCDVNLFCWSCLHHIDMLQRGIISKNIRCEERKKQLQDLIWEEE